jgi:hypothetical protein
VEKNLFSPDREKWTMEPYDRGSKEAKVKQGKIDDIILSGTIVSEKVKSAVLSESGKKKQQDKSSFYLEGDYMSGYLLKKINEKSVVLEDVQSGEEYVFFLNDGKKNRTAVKTEIKDDSKQRKIDKDLKKQRNTKKKKDMAGKPADESLKIKKGLRKNLDSLEKNESNIDLKKAKNYQEAEEKNEGDEDKTE